MINDRRTRSPHFSHSTNGRLGRVLVDALRSRSHRSRQQFENAVGDATRELKSAGLADPAVLATLGDIVEDTGRECGADKPSLMTGEPRWMPVRIQVLETAGRALRSAFEFPDSLIA